MSFEEKQIASDDRGTDLVAITSYAGGVVGGVLFAIYFGPTEFEYDHLMGAFFIGSVAGGAAFGSAGMALVTAITGPGKSSEGARDRVLDVTIGAIGGGIFGGLLGSTTMLLIPLGLPVLVVGGTVWGIWKGLWRIGKDTGVVVLEPQTRTRPDQLTPSDLVYLGVLQKADPPPPVRDGMEVRPPPNLVVDEVLATAFVANQAAGVTHLEIEEGGMRVTVSQCRCECRAGSLEASVAKNGTVSEIVEEWDAEMKSTSVQAAIERLHKQAVRDGILESLILRRRVLNLFTMSRKHDIAKSEMLGELTRRPVELLEMNRIEHPVLHARLLQEIAAGLQAADEESA